MNDDNDDEGFGHSHIGSDPTVWDVIAYIILSGAFVYACFAIGAGLAR